MRLLACSVDVPGSLILPTLRGMGASEDRQIFRPHRVLAVLMALAGATWALALGFLLSFEGIPGRLLAGSALFVLFFAAATLYYARTSLVVDPDGVTYRGMLRTRRFFFGEIRRVDVFPGPITVYAIRGADGFCHFTNFFPGHRALADLLVQRAGLAPLRG